LIEPGICGSLPAGVTATSRAWPEPFDLKTFFTVVASSLGVTPASVFDLVAAQRGDGQSFG
jgi:hypothetical protein